MGRRIRIVTAEYESATLICIESSCTQIFLKKAIATKPINVLSNHKIPRVEKLITPEIPPWAFCATIMLVTEPIIANITYVRPVQR